MKAKISEIFTSIQGEGIFAGQKHLFVRFRGCQLACEWCDTERLRQREVDDVNALSVEEAGSQIQELLSHCQAVSLTGGEPLLQADFIKELGEHLKSIHIPILLETNGILTEELARVIHFIDIISMDFKLPSSTKGKAFWKEHEAFLTEAIQKSVYVKVVITLETDLEDIQESVAIIKRVKPEIPLILQPNYLQMGQAIIEKCMAFQEECLSSLPEVRILPQLHKILNVK